MIDKLYLNEQFVSAIRDGTTVGIAYKFNDKTNQIFIISLKSKDNLITKIKYYVFWLFGGYHSLELAVQKELCKRNVTHLFDLEKMNDTTQRVSKLQEETKALSEQKSSLVADLDALHSNLSATKANLTQAEEQLKSSREESYKCQQLSATLKNEENGLRRSIDLLNKQKNGLEGLLQSGEKKLLALGEEHWSKIQSFLQGSSPAEYLKVILKRMASRKKDLEHFEDSYDHADKYIRFDMSQKLEDYICGVPDIKTEILAGVKSEKQKNTLLVKMTSINLWPKLAGYNDRKIVMDALQELAELDFRYHHINQMLNF